MKRRSAIKIFLAIGSAVLLPEFTYASELDLSKIEFSSEEYSDNKAQTIIIFMYGGASQLSGNLTNIDEIEKYSQSSYSYFRGLTKTTNNCWQEAGGSYMEDMLNDGDMTIFRTCYSQVREDENIRAHGVCIEQNQKGSFDDTRGGILTNLAHILEANGVVDSNTQMPFVTMEGESNFYATDSLALSPYLRPMGLDEKFDNPYYRNVRNWLYYTHEERENSGYNSKEDGFDPALDAKMEKLSQSHNEAGKIKDAFSKRASLSNFIEKISSSTTPDLGSDSYPKNNFSPKIEAAIKLLSNNPDTKVVTLGTGGLGGWDDHNEARDYVTRMNDLFASLKSAMAHLKAVGKEDSINIMVFAEFGRNVNLNSANGWDHGNLQNLYVLGGKGYFNHKGIVGETVVDNTGSLNRLWLKPKKGTYWFEPMSIASTIYKIYGIENPEELTGGYGVIEPLFS
jgi:hypothetical protein